MSTSRSNAVAHLDDVVWGHVDGAPCHLVTFGDDRLRVSVTTYGGYLQRVQYRNAASDPWADMILGHDTLDEYLIDPFFLGATVGRVANRIADGKFQLNGESYQLTRNNGPNALHGGPRGFGKRLWSHTLIDEPERVGVALRLVSRDGDEGYPGSLHVRAEYVVPVYPDRDPLAAAAAVSRAPALEMTFAAVAGRATHVNIVNHAYWNLSGWTSRPSPSAEGEVTTIVDHRLKLNGDFYVAVDANRTPTGEIRSVAGTALDFRGPSGASAGTFFGKTLSDGIGENLTAGTPGGYDHAIVLRGEVGRLRHVGSLLHPASGRFMTIATTCPGVQVYSGNFVRPSKGYQGVPFGFRSGLCLETQMLPGTPNHGHFVSTKVGPGRPFFQKTVHTFGRITSGEVANTDSKL